MPDTVFGIEIPEIVPVGVFPFDPDYQFRRGRKWVTEIHRFSPLLEQRVIVGQEPEITWQIGFSALRGHFIEEDSNFVKLWDFFNAHMGMATPFYFYDPVPWSRYSDKTYRDNPEARLGHPGDISEGGIIYGPTTGRYVCLFDSDEMSADAFERRLRRTELILRGYAG